MDKYYLKDVISLKSSSDSKIDIPVSKLWGKGVKKLKNFPLREFAEVYHLINTSVESRNYLNYFDYGDYYGYIIVHLYNIKDDFIIDVIDGLGEGELETIDGRIVVKDGIPSHSCRYSFFISRR